jgi:HD-GYP domain-containing protein (c-di-GMP phosphodiesterase class II)
MIQSFQCDYPEIDDLLQVTEDLNHIKDIYSLLDRLLGAARRFTHADAGSIFLKEGDNLRFGYVHNDTLYKNDPEYNRHIYTDLTIPINEKSIAGYVAQTGETLNIPDVYEIDPSLPYSFNRSFDEKANYRTRSVLAVPLSTSRGQITGVMQIINSQDDKDNVIPFSEESEMFVTFFGNNASVAIERAQMTKEIILRMIRMAELRDPKETGSHVNRVGSMAVEIYHTWARKKNLSAREIRNQKDIMRIAAMLHDVGKVAISDVILKKPARLDDDEYKVMKTHTYQGFLLFDNNFSELDRLSGEIAYTHHEKFDGSGYPRGMKGTEIPLAGRITAIADVYDALINKRVYKEPWDENKVIDYMKQESGRHFDPELLEAFLESYETIRAIRTKFPD